MAWIETTSPENAAGELQEIYKAISSTRGGVADIHQAQSLNPRALRAHLELYKAVVFARSSLSRIARERIAIVVSASNRCAYCVAHHSEALRQLGDDAATIETLGRGELPTTISAGDRALLEWARTAALVPSDATEATIATLRAHGFDDRALLDAALTVAYFSFVNRLVLLLGVHVEENFQKTCGEVGDA